MSSCSLLRLVPQRSKGEKMVSRFDKCWLWCKQIIGSTIKLFLIFWAVSSICNYWVVWILINKKKGRYQVTRNLPSNQLNVFITKLASNSAQNENNKLITQINFHCWSFISSLAAIKHPWMIRSVYKVVLRSFYDKNNIWDSLTMKAIKYCMRTSNPHLKFYY